MLPPSRPRSFLAILSAFIAARLLKAENGTPFGGFFAMAAPNCSNQLEIIWDLVGSPNEDNMPGWKSLPGGEHLSPRPRPGNISTRFRE